MELYLLSFPLGAIREIRPVFERSAPAAAPMEPDAARAGRVPQPPHQADLVTGLPPSQER